MVELVLSGLGEGTYAKGLGWRPITIGRAPGSDLVVTDSQVSWTHATVWQDQGRVFIRDLGSSNGTFVNDRRLGSGEAAPIAATDKVRLGGTVHLDLREGSVVTEPSRGLLIEHIASGVSVPVAAPRFNIGSDPRSDLRLADGPAQAATLIVHDDGEVWMGSGDSLAPVPIDTPFDVAGHSLRLRATDDHRPPTVVPNHVLYPYVLTVESKGPSARLEHIGSGTAYVADTGHRAVLLYLLGMRYARDRADGLAEAKCGWSEDQEVQSGIWGKNRDANKYHVLLHRLRADLREHGFDPWFIEKRTGSIRARLAEVHVVPSDEP
jgi:hypothetical protein